MALRGDNAKKTLVLRHEARVSPEINSTNRSSLTPWKKSSPTHGGGLSNYATSSIQIIHCLLGESVSATVSKNLLVIQTSSIHCTLVSNLSVLNSLIMKISASNTPADPCMEPVLSILS